MDHQVETPAMADPTLCVTCGHAAEDHDAGECWAWGSSRPVGHEQCPCSWYQPGGGTS